MRRVLKVVHPLAGMVAFLTILSFWLSTIGVELFGDAPALASVKQAIAWGLLLLVPALAVTGASGFRLGHGGARVAAKKKRMPIIAANGILILAPSAVALAILSARGEFGFTFWLVQAFELTAGAVNLTLIALNIRDGFALTRRFAAPRDLSSAESAPRR